MIYTVLTVNDSLELSIHNTSTSVVVSWTHAGTNVLYNISWYWNSTVGCPKLKDYEDHGSNMIADIHNYTIRGLQENSWYNITLVASNGVSEVSISSTARTATAGELFIIMVMS